MSLGLTLTDKPIELHQQHRTIQDYMVDHMIESYLRTITLMLLRYMSSSDNKHSDKKNTDLYLGLEIAYKIIWKWNG